MPPPLSIAVLHLKGGSGKTTLAVALASAAHLAGLRTKLIDTDVQASSLAWGAQRAEGSKLEGLNVELAVSKSIRRIEYPRFVEMTTGFDVTIIDGPAREEGITRSAAFFADVALIPIAPGPTDMWAVRETLSAIDDADLARMDRGRPHIRRCFVVNAARIGSVLARDAREEIEEGLAGEVVGVIHHRVSLPRAMARGETVLTLPVATEAATEIGRLWRTLRGSDGPRTKLKKPSQATPRGRARRKDVALRG